MADQSSFRRILTTMQNTVQGRTTGTPNMPALQQQTSSMCGWLKKQGGIVKSWHTRWFTIKGDQIYYFATDDETKPPLGTIFLPGNKVTEVPLNPNEPDKFLFEIVPGSDRSRMTMTHETYPICAGSDEERKRWVHAIKKVMYAEKGGAIFGQPLAETMAFENRTSKRKVPQIVELCIEFLLEHGLRVEGIFRLPGRSTVIKRLREEFDSGEQVPFVPTEVDVHSVASLLKLYLRELPEPLIPVTFYESVMKIVTRDFHLDPENALDRLSKLLTNIPRHNYNLLQYLSHFLLQVSLKADLNKMPIMNLATVFVQNNIIQPEDNDAVLLMGTSNGRTQVAFLLIRSWEKLFQMDYNFEGVSVQVDKLLDLDFQQTLESKAGKDLPTERPARVTSELLDLDFSPQVTTAVNPMTEIEGQEGGRVSEAQLGTDTDTSQGNAETAGSAEADELTDGTLNGMDVLTSSPSIESGLSLSQSSLTEVTADTPSDVTTSWSCSSYDISSFPNTPSFPGTPSEPQPPQRPPRSLPGSTSNQELSSVRSPSKEATQPTRPAPVPSCTQSASAEPLRPVRPAPLPPPRVRPRPSLSSSSLSIESVETVDSGHVDLDDEDSPEDVHLDTLLNTDLSHFKREDLLTHVETLCDEIRTMRTRNQNLASSRAALKEKQKRLITEHARRLEAEKAATADAVYRIMELQNMLQNLELKHGQLA